MTRIENETYQRSGMDMSHHLFLLCASASCLGLPEHNRPSLEGLTRSGQGWT